MLSWTGEERRGTPARAQRHGVAVLDDDADRAQHLVSVLSLAGIEASVVTSGAGGETSDCDALVYLIGTGIVLNGIDPEGIDRHGAGVGDALADRDPTGPAPLAPSGAVVVVIGEPNMLAAVAAFRAGAYDFVSAPIDEAGLLRTVRRALEHASMSGELDRLRRLERQADVRALGGSPVMQRLSEMIARVAASDVAVLVHGETGTGKELVVHAIHDGSARCKRPFIGINCAAVPASLLESELFGHVRGAFTDAKSNRAGIFVEANGGTLFLDEVGDMTLEMQAKLLRALQERRVRPIGGSAEVAFDVRVIAATHHDLEELVRSGRFREDLLFRLNVVTIEVPPLRERSGDVLEIASARLASAAAREGRAPLHLSPAVADLLVRYDWPGNVRELENCIERAVALARTAAFSPDDLPDRIRRHRADRVVETGDADNVMMSLDEFEMRYIRHVVKLMGGNKTRAAELLGVDRRTLHRRLSLAEPEPPRTSATTRTD
jgi:two-component system response regulator HydG